MSYQVYYHKLGTQQADDKLIYDDPASKGIQLSASVSSDDRFLILDITWESRIANRLYYRPIDDDGEFIRAL